MSQAIHIKDGVNYSGYNMGGGDANDNFRGTLEEWNNLSPEQQAQYNTRDLIDDFNGTPIDTDLDPTSTHPVENQAIAKNIEAVVNVYGSKNLLPSTCTTSTINGLTFTVNSDESVTVNGTASADTLYEVSSPVWKTYLKTGQKYILSGCPAGGSLTTYRLYNGYTSGGVIDIGEGVEFTMSSASAIANGRGYIYILNGTVCNNLVFYPMIRDARITDPTYVPYAMTNREITDKALNWGYDAALSCTKGTAKIQYNDLIKMAVVNYQAGNNTGSGTITLPSGIVNKYKLYAPMRGSGYLVVEANASVIDIVDAQAYDVGQMIFVYK